MSIGTIARRAAGVLGAGAGLAFSAPASAETHPSCSSATRIGTTGHVTVGGARVGSIPSNSRQELGRTNIRCRPVVNREGDPR